MTFLSFYIYHGRPLSGSCNTMVYGGSLPLFLLTECETANGAEKASDIISRRFLGDVKTTGFANFLKKIDDLMNNSSYKNVSSAILRFNGTAAEWYCAGNAKIFYISGDDYNFLDKAEKSGDTKTADAYALCGQNLCRNLCKEEMYIDYIKSENPAEWAKYMLLRCAGRAENDRVPFPLITVKC